MEFLASMYRLEASSSLWPMVLSHDSLIDIWSTHMPLPFLEREHVSVCLSTSSSAVAHCKRKNYKSRTRSWILLCVKLKWISVSADVSSHPACLLFSATPLSFLHNAPFLLWPQPTHQQGSLLSLRKTGGYDCKSVHIWWEGFCLHVFSIWNAAFANTHSGLGGTQQIFLVTPATLLKTSPPTPAQLFQVIPQ